MIQRNSRNCFCGTFICETSAFLPGTVFHFFKDCSPSLFKTFILINTIRFVLKSTPRKLKKRCDDHHFLHRQIRQNSWNRSKIDQNFHFETKLGGAVTRHFLAEEINGWCLHNMKAINISEAHEKGTAIWKHYTLASLPYSCICSKVLYLKTSFNLAHHFKISTMLFNQFWFEQFQALRNDFNTDNYSDDRTMLHVSKNKLGKASSDSNVLEQ